MNKNKIIISIILALIVIGAIFLIQKGKTGDNEKANKNLDNVTIGYSALRISLPVFVAEEKGFFKDEGLKVDLKRYDTAQPLMASLIAGNINIAGYTALPITYNMMLRSKTDLYFSTSMIEDQKHRISYLIVPKDTKKDFKISDLKGKKIGILPTIAYKAWMEQILLKNNIKIEDVELVQINPALSPTALKSGQVDALFTNDPAATTVLQQGIGRLLSDEVEVPKYLGEPFVFGSFNIRKDFADKNPKITKKVLSAIDKAVDFVNKNPDESKELMKKYLHESQAPFVKFYPNALYLNSSESTEKMYQDISEQYLKIGIIKKKLDLKGLIK